MGAGLRSVGEIKPLPLRFRVGPEPTSAATESRTSSRSRRISFCPVSATRPAEAVQRRRFGRGTLWPRRSCSVAAAGSDDGAKQNPNELLREVHLALRTVEWFKIDVHRNLDGTRIRGTIDSISALEGRFGTDELPVYPSHTPPRSLLEAKRATMRKRLSLTAFVLSALVAGCGDTMNPTAPLLSRPSFDGGWTIGSGGRSDTTTSPPSNTSATGETICASGEDSGGWTIGSGGAAQDADQCEVQ